jgi:hypothetical protein
MSKIGWINAVQGERRLPAIRRLYRAGLGVQQLFLKMIENDRLGIPWRHCLCEALFSFQAIKSSISLPTTR